MRLSDVAGFAVSGLWRQKARTALTLSGVAVGACSLAFSLSLGVGLRELIDREFQSRPGFWEVQVLPGSRANPSPPPDDAVRIEGAFSPDRAQRMTDYRAWQYRQHHGGTPVPLTPEALADLATIDDVTAVKTVRDLWGFAARPGAPTQPTLIAAAAADEPALQDRLADGRLPEPGEDACAVSELLLYGFGVRDEAGMLAALGQPVTLSLAPPGGRSEDFIRGLGPRGANPAERLAAAKLLADLPRLVDAAALSADEKDAVRRLLAPGSDGPAKPPAARTLTVVGVLRAPVESADARENWFLREAHVYLPPAAGAALLADRGDVPDGRFDRAEVRVRPGADLPRVVAAVEARGFATHSGVKWFRNAKREVTLIAAGLNVFALISLLVAAIGITNTLVTSVVERTREIGILKALGMRDGTLLAAFLLEGALIGALGGAVGLGMARLAAGPADDLVRKLVEQQANGEKIITQSVFEFPPWLMGTTVAFAAAVTTAAALYPARRASRVPPVEALRHE